MAWRLAKSLDVLRAQINALSPNRSKASDGTIGDEAHASRSSDHNPWVKDGTMGIVTGMDITHDPAHGIDSEQLAEMLRASRDSRIKYIISNKKIAGAIATGGKPAWAWRKYTGSNPHNKHIHVSVKSDKAEYDSIKPWLQLQPDTKAMAKPAKPELPVLRNGDKGTDVATLQTLLKIEADGNFGAKTAAAVKKFQREHGLIADATVGSYTWEALSA